MNTEELIKEAKARFHLNYQKTQITEKYEGKLIFADQGGLWKSNTQLFATLSSFQDDEIILLDMYNSPIKVKRKELLEKAKSIYCTVMQDWFDEYESLKNKR